MNGLRVPAKWLSACGMGSEDRIFPVLKIARFKAGDGSPITVVAVDVDGRQWTVIVELRGAEFVELSQLRIHQTPSAIAGSLGFPSKMPGTSYGLPAKACITGAKLAPIKGSTVRAPSSKVSSATVE